MNTQIERGGTKAIFRRILASKTFIVLAALFALYTVVGFLLLPYVIKQQAIQYATQTLQRRLAMEEVVANPYTFTLTMRHLDLKEQDATPILGFKELFINFALYSSLKNWAFAFDLIRLDHPKVNVLMRKDGKLNLQELAAAAAGEKSQEPEEESPPTRLLLHQLLIQSGSVDISDHRVSTPARVTLQPLNLEVRDLTTIPERRGPYTIAARMPDGSALRWRGDEPLHPVWSGGTLSNEKIKVGAIETTGGTFNFRERKTSVDRLNVRGGLARASLDEKGSIDWLKLMELKVAPAQGETPASAANEPPWQLGVGTVEISEFGAQVTDRRFPNPIQLDLDRLHFKLTGFHDEEIEEELAGPRCDRI